MGGAARTLGYYEPGDGGGAIYNIVEDNTLVDDGGSVHDLNNDLKAKLVIENEINVKQFGAYGDNQHDDTLILNNIFDFAIKNGIRIFIPTGNYLITEPLYIFGSYELDNKSVFIIGEERGSSKIIANHTMDSMLILSSIGNHARRINISNLIIDGKKLSNNGITAAVAVSESTFDNIKIQNCLNYDFYSIKNFYLNSLNKVMAYNSNYGFYIYGGNNTSINLLDCYCSNCINAYKISGIYNVMTNCCADGSDTTGIVFDLDLYRGTVISPGSEAYKAISMFKGGNRTNVTIIGGYTWGNDINENAIHIDVGNGRFLFVGGYILADRNENNTVMPGKLFEKGAYGFINFFGTRFSQYNQSNTTAAFAYSNATLVTGDSKNTLIRYDNKISFLGADGRLDGGLANSSNITNSIPANAIFFGLGDNVRTRADGVDLNLTGINSKGDILLSRNPEKIGAIGWIQSVDNHQSDNAYWRNGKYYKIPVIFAENSDTRIQNPEQGQMMFDKTLKKPIWYDGSKWVDSTGNAV